MALANDWSERKRNEQYDYIVVGSGYGGAINAARIAGSKGNPSVCILERGKEWQVGEFPDTLPHVTREVRSNVNPVGLYEFLTYRDISVLKGNGLGGTSLVNANVAIVPDEEVFGQTGWPKALTRDALLPYYEQARETLNVTPHPRGLQLRKVQALERRASQIGNQAFALDLAVTFKDGPNPQGVMQSACIDCGDCATGCNVGAKNTLYMNYLPLAKQRGAQIFERTKVEWIEKTGSGSWKVHGTRYDGLQREKFTLEAANLILAAGSINTTEILLRSANLHGLAVSPMLGAQFSGNGDFFAIAYNGNQQTNVLGFGNHPNSPRRAFAPGPTIVGAVRYRDGLPLGQRITVEDLTFPKAYVEALKFSLSLIQGEDTDRGDEAEERRRRELDRLRPRDSDRDGALNHTMVYLVMAFDDARGHFVFEAPFTEPDGRVRVEWDDVGRQPVFKRVNDELRRHARALGASFVENPTWGAFDIRHLVTAHPLGGTPIGEDYQQGAVDQYGRVFSGDGAVHRGLFVADGSLIPSALGVNPFLTISAVSERIAEHIVKSRDAWAYPEPSTAVSFANVDARRFIDYREDQLERAFRAAESMPARTMLNKAQKPEVDAATRTVRNDVYWKGFFPKGHVLNDLSAALFTGFKKRFFEENGRVAGRTSDTDNRINARNEIDEIDLKEYKGDLPPGRYIHLKYPDPPWQGFYDIFKIVNEDLMIGRVYLGPFPNGRRLFTFPMVRRYGFEQLTIDDHRELWESASVPDAPELQGVWRMDIIANANQVTSGAYLKFDNKPDGRLEATYQLMGLIEGFIIGQVMDSHFQLNDFTPFRDEIRRVDDDLMVGKWVTRAPEFAPLGSLGILHTQDGPGGKEFGFYYLLTRTGKEAFPPNPLLRPFLEIQVPTGVGIRFEEKMEGYYFPGKPAGADTREALLPIGDRIQGKEKPEGGVECRFWLDLRANDLNELIDGYEHEMHAIGGIFFEEFEGVENVEYAVTENSRFQMIVVNPATQEAEMRYILRFQSHDGRQFLLDARKFLEKDEGGGLRGSPEIMRDFTTLYGRVYELKDGGREELGTTYLRFRTFEDLSAVRDLAQYLLSFRVTGTKDPRIQVQAQARYLAWLSQFLQREYDPLGFSESAIRARAGGGS